MYRIQANQDEKAVVYFQPENVFLPIPLGKKSVLLLYFSLGKDNKKISMS